MRTEQSRTQASVHGQFGLKFPARDFVHPPKRPPPQSGLMTLKKLSALVSAGYGQNHFHLYKPWLRVTRRECSPCSTIGHLPAPELRRLHHFRSRAERSTLILTKWLGAIDGRDQYPAWSWTHRNPVVGLPGMGADKVPGLLEIADGAGIAHGTFAGTDIPYIASLDVLTTWRHERNGFLLVAFDCKPKQIVESAPVGSRIRERLELHRRYCNAAGIRHRLTHPELLPNDLMVNLDLLYPLLGPTQCVELVRSSLYQRVVAACQRDAYDMPAFEVVEEVAARFGMCNAECQRALHMALWNQDLDHDLSFPLELWNPLSRGGHALKRKMLAEWIPEEASS